MQVFFNITNMAAACWPQMYIFIFLQRYAYKLSMIQFDFQMFLVWFSVTDRSFV